MDVSSLRRLFGRSSQLDTGNAVGPVSLARRSLDMLTTAAILVAAVIVTWRAFAAPVGPAPKPAVLKVPAEPISLPAESRIQGNRQARAVLIAYSDFHCSYCGRFARETLPLLIRSYVESGQIRIAFRHLPLGRRESSNKAAAVSVCASGRGNFWAVHDSLFAKESPLTEVGVDAVSASLGLAAPELASCLAAASKVVEEDIETAKALGITATPTFLFGISSDENTVTVRSGFSGARPIAQFVEAIEKLLRSTE